MRNPRPRLSRLRRRSPRPPDAAAAAPAETTPAEAPAAPKEGFAGALEHFLADDYSETDEGITAVAATSDPKALTIIEALQDGRLLFSAEQKKIYYKNKSGALFDAETGAAMATEPGDIDKVRLNNRLRSALDATLGGLRLQVGNADRRFEAAQSVFKSREASVLPALDAALAKEADARVKNAIVQARAAVILYSDSASPAEKLDAVAVIKARGDQDALGLLAGLPADAPPAVVKAARDAVGAIQGNLAVWSGVQNLWYGLSLGSVLLLAAIGLAITFGVMGVINMAHGEMVMIGAYVTFMVQELIRSHNPRAVRLFLADRRAAGLYIRRGHRHPDRAMHHSLPVRAAAGNTAGDLGPFADPATGGADCVRADQPRSWRSVMDERRVQYRADQHHLRPLWIIVFTMMVFVGLLGLLRFTRLGLEMRAVTQNRQMAASMGIRTARVDALTFGLGSGIAGIAGVALSQIDNVSPNLGQGYIIDSFLVVVFGGVGNLWGTLVGALSLGIANKFLEPFAGAVLAKIAILVLIILFIQKRPRGLFALKGRAVEA